MTIREKYGGNTDAAVQRAIRAEIPGGSLLLDALQRVHTENANPLRGRHPAQVAAIKTALELMRQARDALRAGLLASYGQGPAAAQQKTPPMTEAFFVDDVKARSLQSTPAMPPTAKPELSLAALKKSTPNTLRDSREWNPSAAIVEQMGHLTDDELGRMAGVPGELIRRRREKLGIAPVKPLRRWTAEEDAAIRANLDNAAVAAQIGRTPDQVKVRRSRLKAKGEQS